MKKCKKCNEILKIEEFVKHKECKNGYSNSCKKCKLELQRNARSINLNVYTKKYEKTKSGFLMRVYRNMKTRINGTHKKSHLYANKELLDKEMFYNWSINNTDFHNLFQIWEQSDYKRTLTPSIDRIDSDYGYNLKNIRWITFTENCKNVKRLGLNYKVI